MARDQKPNSKVTKKTIKSVKKTSSTKKISTASDPYFNAVFNNASVGIILMDLNRKIIRANIASQRFLNYSQEELSSLSVSEITHHDDYQIDEKLFNEVADGKRSEYTIEKRCITKDGRIVNSRITISSVFDPKQKKKRIIAIVEDITRQQQFETKFSLEQNYIVALLENNPDSIYFKDLNSRFLKISKALAKKLNVHVDDLIGKTDFDVFGVDHAGDAYKDEQEIIKTGIPIIGKEEREDWVDGRIAWVSTSKMPFYDKEEKLIGTFGISRDITIKKRAEQSQEALFRISETAFTAPDMQTLFKKIHDVVGTLMPARNLFIALYNEKEDLLTFPYYVDQYVRQKESTKPQKGMTEYVLRTSQATLIDEKRLHELESSGKIEVIGIPPKIWLGVPLKLYGKTFGVIAVQDYEKP